MTATISYDFPLQRPHAGAPLGNGTLGVLIWGGDDGALQVTVGRAGFWDRRGGNPFVAKTTFAQVRSLLEAKDSDGLNRVFARNSGNGQHPRQVGCGRLTLTFPDGHRPQRAELHTGTGTVRVMVADGAGRFQVLIIRVAAPPRTLAWIEIPPGLTVAVNGAPAFAQCGAEMTQIGLSAPTIFQDDQGGGWCQSLPEDPALALAWDRDGQRITIATVLADGVDQEPRQVYGAARDLAKSLDTSSESKASVGFWHRAWRTMPKLELPDAGLQHQWDLGCFRYLAAVNEDAVACTLQGPWLEDTQLPPWSCDYHFNINVQMIHQPGLALGQASQARPLWRMLHSWLPGMAAAGRAFFGRADALMLPHAVDDRCQAVGSFWTGMIDHGCTGWMALLAYEEWRHSNDPWLLTEIVWPLLTGAHEGYAAMAEQRDGAWSLPVTTSPEYRGDRPDAWGRDASFQLACWHAVVRALPIVAKILDKPVNPEWAQVSTGLPAASLVRGPRGLEYPERTVERIGLWAGLDLLESHRHHSHLAGIWPFQTIDPQSPLAKKSVEQWVRMGAGAWSGWATAWAAAINARIGWGDGALAWLQFQHQVFCNESGASLHDGFAPGQTVLVGVGSGGGSADEIFQLDAGMGALTAIQLLMLQEHAGVLVIAPAIPRRWRRLTVDGLAAPGGLRVGFSLRDGRVQEVRLLAERAWAGRVRHGLASWRDDAGRLGDEPEITVDLPAGGMLTLRSRTSS